MIAYSTPKQSRIVLTGITDMLKPNKTQDTVSMLHPARSHRELYRPIYITAKPTENGNIGVTNSEIPKLIDRKFVARNYIGCITIHDKIQTDCLNGVWANKRNITFMWLLFCVSVCSFVCHKPVLYQNG